MRLIFSLLTYAGITYGGWSAYQHIPQVREIAQKTLNKSDFCTLEIRYTADEIMRVNKDQLLKGNGYSYLEPQLLYYPYVLMDVKYSKDRATTTEGTLLWGLTDGEMITNTTTWEKTHGFEDCLLSKADKNDFKVIKALVENSGAIDREKLYNHFNVDHDILDDWIDSCREKKLIVISGNKFRLHFAAPRIEIQPTTLLNQALVSQPAKYSSKVNKQYSPSQIGKLAQIAFGGDFTIRKSTEVFLPVYRIGIQNPDGSTRSVYVNALNGKLTSLR